MNALIIDDSEDKVNALRGILADWNPAMAIHVARSFQGAISALLKFEYRIVLLDMTLPTYEHPDGRADGRQRLYGGRELLAEMEFENVATKVVICTQFDSFPGPNGAVSLGSLLGELLATYPKLLVGGVYYSHVDSCWRREIAALLKKIDTQII